MSRAGWFLSAVALCCFSWRLFFPPLIGLANNGDFAKIAGRLHLGPAASVTDDRFLYVTRDYKRAPEFAWNSHYQSSEAVFALAAYGLSWLFQQRDHFDIRWMGVVHLAVIMAAFVWLMAALRPLGLPAQITAGLMAIIIFSDAAYLAYCNSFYTDAAALAGTLLAVAALIDLAVRGSSTLRLAGFLVGTLLVETSKTQHTLLALPLAVLVWVAVRSRAAMVAGLIVLAVAPVFTAASESFYRADNLFSVVFFKITPHSPTPLEDLVALGLASEDLRYIGMHAYTPGAPTGTLEFGLHLVRRVSMGRLARFYLTHPKRTAAFLAFDLTRNAYKIHVSEFGNYTADSGRLPQTHAPGYWTAARSRLLERAPWLAPLWLALAAAVCLIVRSKLAWICLGTVIMAVMEFAIASLLDATDTSRHLLMFQVFVEITICFAATAAVRAAWKAGRSEPAPRYLNKSSS